MRRLLAFVGGVLSGGAVGTALALLFAPRSGTSMRAGLREQIAQKRQAGHAAAAARRRALEDQWHALTGLSLPGAEPAQQAPVVQKRNHR